MTTSPAMHREFLTDSELQVVRAAVVAQLKAASSALGIRGYYFTGPSTQRRLHIQIEYDPATPSLALPSIVLPPPLGGWLLFDVDRVARWRPPKKPTPKGLPVILQPLAPGSAITVEGRQGGVSFLCKLDGVPHLVTCGHLFRRSDPEQWVQAGDTVAAKLAGTLLPDLDAAYCALLDDGLDLLNRSLAAESWHHQVKEIGPDLVGGAVTFYATSGFYEQAPQTYIENDDVTQYNFRLAASEDVLPSQTWSGLDLTGLLMTPQITIGGDSGSLLVFGEVGHRSYLALCSGGGFNGSREHSFFTPIAHIIQALRQKFEVVLWEP